MIAFSIYAGINLWTLKKNAVYIAKLYLILFLVYTFIELFLWITVLPSKVINKIIGDFTKEIVGSLLYFIIWFSYLNKSKRVKNTFDIV